MVYESDFYTTRRPYRASPSLASYTVSKREIPWEKVPFVARPSLVPEPVTAFGRPTNNKHRYQGYLDSKSNERHSEHKRPEKLIITPLPRASIRASVIITPPKPYLSPRDQTRERVKALIQKRDLVPQELPSTDAMDIVLPRVHKSAEAARPYRRTVVFSDRR